MKHSRRLKSVKEDLIEDFELEEPSPDKLKLTQVIAPPPSRFVDLSHLEDIQTTDTQTTSILVVTPSAHKKHKVNTTLVTMSSSSSSSSREVIDLNGNTEK